MSSQNNQFTNTWRALELGLIEAAALRTTVDDSGRLAAARAVVAVIDFLTAAGMKQDLLAPLMDTIKAFEDLEHGARPEMLKPLKLGHRPPSTNDHRVVRIYAAAAMEFFVRSSIGKDEAAHRVFRAVTKWDIDLPVKSHRFDPNTIANWREEISGGNKVEDWETARFRQLIARVEEAKIDFKVAAQNLLKAPPPFVRVKSG